MDLQILEHHDGYTVRVGEGHEINHLFRKEDGWNRLLLEQALKLARDVRDRLTPARRY